MNKKRGRPENPDSPGVGMKRRRVQSQHITSNTTVNKIRDWIRNRLYEKTDLSPQEKRRLWEKSNDNDYLRQATQSVNEEININRPPEELGTSKKVALELIQKNMSVRKGVPSRQNSQPRMGGSRCRPVCS